MELERYSGEKQSHGLESITISKLGYININTAASKHFEDFDYVNLYFGKGSEQIGLEPTNEKLDGTYSLIKQSHYNAFKVTCKGFLTHFGISPDETKRLDAEWDDDQDMLIASLENGKEVEQNGRA